MDLSPGTEVSLGLPVSVESLSPKLLVSEDTRRRLQDQIFVLEDRLKESSKRLEQSRVRYLLSSRSLSLSLRLLVAFPFI